MRYVKRTEAIQGWHWLTWDGYMANDRARTKVQVGHTYKVTGAIHLCYRGLHASTNLFQAVRYAPAPVLEKVLLWGEVEEDWNKLCARYRQCIGLVDMQNEIHRFGVWWLKHKYNQPLSKKVKDAIKAKEKMVRQNKGQEDGTDYYANWMQNVGINEPSRLLHWNWKSILSYIADHPETHSAFQRRVNFLMRKTRP